MNSSAGRPSFSSSPPTTWRHRIAETSEQLQLFENQWSRLSTREQGVRGRSCSRLTGNQLLHQCQWRKLGNHHNFPNCPTRNVATRRVRGVQWLPISPHRRASTHGTKTCRPTKVGSSTRQQWARLRQRSSSCSRRQWHRMTCTRHSACPPVRTPGRPALLTINRRTPSRTRFVSAPAWAGERKPAHRLSRLFGLHAH